MDRQAVLTMDVDCLHGHVQGQAQGDRRRRLLQRDDAHIRVSYARWLPRFLDLLDQAAAPCTFFLVAEFARLPECRSLLRRMTAAGHEVASHSLNHPLELRNLPMERQWCELHDSRKLLQDLTGQPIDGFRGPGYAIDPALAEMLLSSGYRYDSSVVPGRLFHWYKAAAYLADRVLGIEPTAYPQGIRRAQGGMFTLARNDAGERPGDRLVELPINVTPRLGLPFVSFIIREPSRFARMHQAIAARERVVLYQFHDFELMDHDDAAEFVLTQATARDQRHPLARRLQFFAQVIAALKASSALATAGAVAHKWEFDAATAAAPRSLASLQSREIP